MAKIDQYMYHEESDFIGRIVNFTLDNYVLCVPIKQSKNFMSYSFTIKDCMIANSIDQINNFIYFVK